MSTTLRKVKLERLTLPKSEMGKMSPIDRKRYIMFTFILQDLNLLQKCLVYSKNDTPTIKIVDRANTTAAVFFMKILISKIYEMWQFLKNNKILSDKNEFSSELNESINKIKLFFSDKKGEKIFRFIRNKIGFHYEYQDDIDSLIDNAFNELKDNEFEMWLSRADSGNDVFVSSTTLMFDVILKQMKKLGFGGDDLTRMRELFSLSQKGASLFQDFSTLYLTEAFKIKYERKETIEIEVPIISSVKLPVIVARNDAASDRQSNSS